MTEHLPLIAQRARKSGSGGAADRKRTYSLGVMCVLLYSIALLAQTVDSIAPPATLDLKPISFWATSYWVHLAENSEKGISLLDISGNPLGPVLSKADWCAAALEGTVRVDGVTYNYAGNGKADFVDCAQFFKPKVGFSRFKVASAPFGEGVSGYILVPYRTVAADPIFLKTGTVMFIPSAVGQPLPGGAKHDGYFFVGDKGGAIKGDHIDVFQGDEPVDFSFIRSKREPLFNALVVTDARTIEVLTRMHKLPK
jgi:3D (Asp-Asp-Asp) domain-containing protein